MESLHCTEGFEFVSVLSAWIALLWLPVVSPRPSPSLGPAEVVRAVVTALGNNNSPIPNAGVFTTYRFASPANRTVSGPYGHFLRLVRSDQYRPLFGRNTLKHVSRHGGKGRIAPEWKGLLSSAGFSCPVHHPVPGDLISIIEAVARG